MIKLIDIKPSPNKEKKFRATFYKNNDYIHIDFGAKGYEDYTIHKDPERKKRYIERHKKNENWNDPLTPGALSRFILWEYTDLNKAIREYKKRFKL